MSGMPDPVQLEAAKAAAQAELENEAKKQSSASAGDAAGSAADIGGNVMMEGVGEAVVALVGGIFKGLGS